MSCFFNKKDCQKLKNRAEKQMNCCNLQEQLASWEQNVDFRLPFCVGCIVFLERGKEKEKGILPEETESHVQVKIFVQK